MSTTPLQLCMNPAPKQLSIPLPYGAELKALVDMSKGPPNSCALVHSLMLQVTPLLAGMECPLRVLKVMKALKDAVSTPIPFSNVDDLIAALGDLAECFLMITPAGIAPLIASILRLIIAYLNCFIDAVLSILDAQVGIDLSSADGNPLLLASLTCAQENTAKSLEGMSGAMGGVQPLMDIVQGLGGIVGLNFTLPSLSDIAGEPEPLEMIRKLRDSLQQIEQVVNSLPV
jgi:hypothetical protein